MIDGENNLKEKDYVRVLRHMRQAYDPYKFEDDPMGFKSSDWSTANQLEKYKQLLQDLIASDDYDFEDAMKAVDIQNTVVLMANYLQAQAGDKYKGEEYTNLFYPQAEDAVINSGIISREDTKQAKNILAKVNSIPGSEDAYKAYADWYNKFVDVNGEFLDIKYNVDDYHNWVKLQNQKQKRVSKDGATKNVMTIPSVEDYLKYIMEEHNKNLRAGLAMKTVSDRAGNFALRTALAAATGGVSETLNLFGNAGANLIAPNSSVTQEWNKFDDNSSLSGIANLLSGNIGYNNLYTDILPGFINSALNFVQMGWPHGMPSNALEGAKYNWKSLGRQGAMGASIGAVDLVGEALGVDPVTSRWAGTLAFFPWMWKRYKGAPIMNQIKLNAARLAPVLGLLGATEAFAPEDIKDRLFNTAFLYGSALNGFWENKLDNSNWTEKLMSGPITAPLVSRVVLDGSNKIRLRLPNHTDEKPREVVLDPLGDNKYYLHARTWDDPANHIPAGDLTELEKLALYNAVYNELPQGAEILVPLSSFDNLATRGTVANMIRLSRDPRFLRGTPGSFDYADKDNNIKTFNTTSFIKK